MPSNFFFFVCVFLPNWRRMHLVYPSGDDRGRRRALKVFLIDLYHVSHLFPLEFPLSPARARARAPLLCLSDCLCFCMCARVSTWMRICMCACVCSLFQRSCNLQESRALGLEHTRAGVCLVLCHLSFSPPASLTALINRAD